MDDLGWDYKFLYWYWYFEDFKMWDWEGVCGLFVEFWEVCCYGYCYFRRLFYCGWGMGFGCV